MRDFILNDDVTPTIAVTGQTLNGTGDDFLVGSAANDWISGQGGADTEFGNKSSDVLNRLHDLRRRQRQPQDAAEVVVDLLGLGEVGVHLVGRGRSLQ